MSILSKQEYQAARSSRELDHAMVDFEVGFDEGFKYALEMFSIWKDGTQRIGCLETPIKEIFEGIRK